MKQLLSLLVLCTVLIVNAQEVDINKDLPKNDIVYVLQLDDKEIKLPYSERIPDGLNLEIIESLNVIKKTNSAEFIAYASKDTERIVIIKLLDTKKSQLFFDAIKEKSDLAIAPLLRESQDNERKVRLRGKSENTNILFQIIIDDKTFDFDSNQEFLGDINPDDIKSIDVIKDKDGLKKYEASDKDGVIVTRLKKNKSSKALLKQLEKDKEGN